MKKYTTSQRLKQIMAERNLKQVDILKKAEPFCQKYNVKLNRNDLSQYVNGKVEPGQQKLSILGLTLNVNEAWLMGYDDVSVERTENQVKKIPYTEAGTALVPLIGRAAAGYTCHAEENITEYIRTDSESLKNGYSYFWLQVKGDSMEPELHENDLVLVQEQESLDRECYAVVTIDDEDGLVKIVDIDSTKITLTSVNPYYPPRVFEKEEMNRVRIVGVVVEIKRKLI